MLLTQSKYYKGDKVLYDKISTKNVEVSIISIFTSKEVAAATATLDEVVTKVYLIGQNIALDSAIVKTHTKA